MPWDDDLDEDDLDEPEDGEGDDDPTAPCPHCGVDVYDDAERCPSCGRYLSVADAPRLAPPAWIVVGVVAALAGLLWWVFRL